MRIRRYLLTAVMAAACSTSMAEPESSGVNIDVADGPNPWTHLRFNNHPGKFQFAILSDRHGHMRRGVFARGVEKLNLLQPEFVMSIGDLVAGYTEDRATVTAQWEELDGIVRKLEMPFFYLGGNHDLTLVLIGNDLDGIADPESHGHQPHPGTGPAADLFNQKPFTRAGHVERHQQGPILQAVGANAVDFHFVLQHVETDGGCDFYLQGFHLFIVKLEYFFALRADHVVMMVSEVMVFIADLAVVEPVFAGKAETAHQIQGLPDKIG